MNDMFGNEQPLLSPFQGWSLLCNSIGRCHYAIACALSGRYYLFSIMIRLSNRNRISKTVASAKSIYFQFTKQAQRHA